MGRASRLNPTAIAARNGELPPKPKKMGKRESERLMMAAIEARVLGPMPKELKEIYYNGRYLIKGE